MSKSHAVQLALIAALALPVAAFAQADPASARVHEPTIDEVYRAAESGRLSDADAMMAHVLSAHPQSAKAHFVHAELLAKEGNLATAKSEYVRADALEPGLPFAKPGAVENLRRTFDSANGTTVKSPVSRSLDTPVAATSASSSAGLPVKIGLVLLLAMAAYLIFGRRSRGSAGTPAATQGFAPRSPATAAAYASTYASPSGMASAPASASASASAPAAPAGSGLGSALMSGAAMGLGAVAVQQAVNYFSHREGTAVATTPAPVQTNQPAFPNNLGPDTSDDLGGNDFGITDAGSWDDGARDSGNDLNDGDNGW